MNATRTILLCLLLFTNAFSEILRQPAQDDADQEQPNFSFASTPSIFGRIQVIQSDSFTDDSYNRTYLLQDQHSSKVYHLIDIPFIVKDGLCIHDLQSGMHVRVHGTEVDVVHSHYWGENYGSLSVSSVHEVSPSRSEPLRDTQVNLHRMVVLIVNFQDAEVSCNVSSLDNIMWRADYSVRGMFESDSFAQVEFAGDVEGNTQWDIFGPFTINAEVSSKKCDAGNWADMADDLAIQAGVYFPNYQHRVYVLPDDSQKPCHWEGLGWVGCSDIFCRAWINTCARMEVFVHELGHNLGMSHASSDFDDIGNVVVYGDPTAFMGNKWFSASNQLTFNAVHKNLTGWFSDDDIRSLTPSASGTYKISPVNILPSNAAHEQVIRFQHPDTMAYFYLSYMTIFSNYSLKCLVHRLDNSSAPSIFIKALSIGETYIDPYQRFSATFWSLDPDGMSIAVGFGCTSGPTLIDFYSFLPKINSPISGFQQTPEISWSNFSEFSIAMGQDIDLTMRLANTDSPLCTAINYAIDPILPMGWQIDIPKSWFLNPGQTCFIDFKLKSAQVSRVGTFDIGIRVNGTTSDMQHLNMHDTTVWVNVDLTNQKCPRNVPTVTWLESQNFYLPGQPFVQILSLQNNDGPTCEQTTFNLKVSSPVGGVILTSQKNEMALNPGEISFNILNVDPGKLNVPTWEMILEFSSPAGEHVFNLNQTFQLERECGGNPKIQVENYVTLPTRDSISTPLIIQNNNPSHCWPTTYTLHSTNPRAEFVPPYLTIPSNSTGISVILYTSSMLSSQLEFNLTVPVSIQNPFVPTEHVDVSVDVTVDRTSCVPQHPGISLTCPPSVDNNTDTFTCYFYFANYDNWPCPTTTWRLNVTLDPPLEWTSESFYQNQEIPYFPSNYTTWVPFVISLGTDYVPEVSVQIQFEDVSSKDPATIAIHYNTQTLNPTVGRCIRNPPTVVPTAPTNLTVFLGDTNFVEFSVKNNDGEFCKFTRLWTGQSPEATWFVPQISPSSGFNPQFSGGIGLSPGQTGNYRMYITPNPDFFNPPFNSTFNLNVTIYNPRNRTYLSDTFNLNVNLSSECVLRPPMMTIDLDHVTIPSGKSASQAYQVNVTNRDVGNCPPSSYGFGANEEGSPGNGWTFYGSPIEIIDLKVNETKTSVITAVTRENLIPGNFKLNVWIGSMNGKKTHAASNFTTMTVTCPVPRPVKSVKANVIEPFFSFGMQAGPVFLKWDGCANGLECCCPCTFRVERNGEYIGTSTSRNFTDSSDLKTGVKYWYNVTVTDRNGITASVYACDTTVTFQLEPPSLTLFFTFMSVSVSSLFGLALFVFLVIYVIQRRLDMKSDPDLRFLPDRFYEVMHRAKEALRPRRNRVELTNILGQDPTDEESVSLLHLEEEMTSKKDGDDYDE